MSKAFATLIIKGLVSELASRMVAPIGSGGTKGICIGDQIRFGDGRSTLTHRPTHPIKYYRHLSKAIIHYLNKL